MKRIGRFGVQLALGASLVFGATGALATTVITDNPYSRFNATGTYAARLTIWFGKGSLTLTSIFDAGLWAEKRFLETGISRFPSPDEINDGVSGKGPTFTIIGAANPANGMRYVIGWYNPINGVTPFGGNAGETAYDAFIFNFTTNAVMRPVYDPFATDEEIVSNVRVGTQILLEDAPGRIYHSADTTYPGTERIRSILWDPTLGARGLNDNYGYNSFEVYAISVDALAAVPEPATWTTMLIGFGLIGGGVRTSRRRAMAAGA